MHRRGGGLMPRFCDRGEYSGAYMHAVKMRRSTDTPLSYGAHEISEQSRLRLRIRTFMVL